MLRIVARLSRRARRMPSRSPLTSVTAALSIATSAPVPIAMPICAWASAAQRLQRGGRIMLDRIGDGDEPGGTAVDRDQHHALAVPTAPVGLFREAARIDVERREQRRVADCDLLAVDRPNDALSGQRA